MGSTRARFRTLGLLLLLALTACAPSAAGSAPAMPPTATTAATVADKTTLALSSAPASAATATTGSRTSVNASMTDSAGPAATATPAATAAADAVSARAAAPLPPSPPTPLPASAGYPGQSNRVPAGYPTPNTADERLIPGGPARDPGSLTWARPGPYIAPHWTDFRLTSFGADQRLATTYYFYWFDLTNRGRNGRFGNGQFDTPVDAAHYSFLSPATHLQQFADMEAAGLDFVLPVYWGEPGHPGRTTAETAPHYWSTEGIPAMVEAEDELRASGAPPLPIGMFYDTTILANADLTTPDGMAYFYVNVRDFYSRIPPKYWAAIDGKPIVWLYDTLWVAKFDQASLDYVSDHFAKDFGGLRPYIVIESQWEHSKGVFPPQSLHADGVYGWGSAANGYNPDPRLTVAEVGPGFTNTAYCKGGSARNCFDISRQGGAYYERELAQAVASNHAILAVETWNEFSEGTDIADTTRYGRKYIDLTREYADRFKARPVAPEG